MIRTQHNRIFQSVILKGYNSYDIDFFLSMLQFMSNCFLFDFSFDRLEKMLKITMLETMYLDSCCNAIFYFTLLFSLKLNEFKIGFNYKLILLWNDLSSAHVVHLSAVLALATLAYSKCCSVHDLRGANDTMACELTTGNINYSLCMLNLLLLARHITHIQHSSGYFS